MKITDIKLYLGLKKYVINILNYFFYQKRSLE